MLKKVQIRKNSEIVTAIMVDERLRIRNKIRVKANKIYITILNKIGALDSQFEVWKSPSHYYGQNNSWLWIKVIKLWARVYIEIFYINLKSTFSMLKLWHYSKSCDLLSEYYSFFLLNNNLLRKLHTYISIISEI